MATCSASRVRTVTIGVRDESVHGSVLLENLSAAQDRREIQRRGFAARPADGFGGPSGLVFLPIDPCVDKGHTAYFEQTWAISWISHGELAKRYLWDIFCSDRTRKVNPGYLLEKMISHG